MTVVSFDSLMERASLAIQQRPHQLTKTQLAKLIGGKRRRALAAIDLLCSQGFAATSTGAGGWPVYHSLKQYPVPGGN